MAVSSVSGPSQVVTLELPEEAQAEAGQEAPESAAPVPMAAAASAPMVLEEPAMSLMSLGEPEAAAMMASSGNASDVSYITFSSLDMAATIMGLTAAQKSALALLNTLTFEFKRTGNQNEWTPVVQKRAGKPSFADLSQNQVEYVSVGSAIANMRPTALPTSMPDGKTKFDLDFIRAMSSEDQRALLYQYGIADPTSAATGLLTLQLKDGNPLTIAASGDTTAAVTIILSQTGKPITVDNLDNRSIAKLTVKEQQLIAGLPVFTRSNGLGAKLGLVTAIPVEVQNAINAINGYTVPAGTSLTNFSVADRKIFLDQIELIKSKLSNQSIYHAKTIQDEVAAVLKRFEVAYAYGSVPAQTGPSGYIVYSGGGGHYQGHMMWRYSDVISLDEGAAVKSGFENFMAQEKRLLELNQARVNTTASPVGGKMLDVPTIIVRLQLYYNLEKEAEINIKSEEVRQQNELLKTYAFMQQAVSKLAGGGGTIDYLGKGSGDGSYQRDVYAVNQNNPDELFRLFGITSMFAVHREDYGGFERYKRFKGISGSTQLVTAVGHPIEKIRDLGRPKVDMFYDYYSNDAGDFGEYLRLSSSAWSAFGTRLADTVTLINQQSQIQMNDISAAEKEKTRYFESGTGALSRLSEIISSIARNIS